MKKIFLSILKNIIFITIFIFIFLYSKDVKESIFFAFDIWVNKLIPSIFPFLLISSFLINYGFIDFLSITLGPLFSKIFKVSKESTYAIITSIFTGFPTGSIYVKDLLKEQIINIEEANHLIMFTSFSNPLFVISAVGESLLKNKKIGVFLFIVHLLSGLLIGFIFRKRVINTSKGKKRKKEKKFIEVLKNSIEDSFKVLINMLGIIIFSLIIITMIDKLFNNNYISLLVKGLIEVTSGISFISSSNINIRLKTAIIGMFLSFNGISVHMQTKNIIEGTDIKYKNYLIARLIHALLCFIIIFLFFNLFISY